MNKIVEFLAGRYEVEGRNSIVNGKLRVMRDIAFGIYVEGGGLPQSGGLASVIWEKILDEVKKEGFNPKKCLILGLGGGSIAKLTSKHWPKVEIVGVDIDPVMVELGKKYLGLDKVDLTIVIKDAFEFLDPKYNPQNTLYDLICIDTYVGDQFPEKFASGQFLKFVKNHLSQNGMAIFNRLYGGKHIQMADEFGKILKDVFPKMDKAYPNANIMFVCSK